MRKRIGLTIQQKIVDSYLAGLSTHKIAQQLSISPSSVFRILKRLGICFRGRYSYKYSRVDSQAVIFNGRKYAPKLSGESIYHIATTDPRTRLSRDMWEFYTGEKLDSSIVIHHKNEDTLDDRMENFTKTGWGIHSHKHLTGIKRSDETRQKISIGKSKPNPIRSRNILGENNPNWKGGHSNSYKYRKVEPS